ncbi:MAG: hypothetical protein QOJ64_1581 [Acidobacteriota bacterium]|jgi:hypothetical protein|nr:hypothetical protein [Acidobacteriota bacterium]
MSRRLSEKKALTHLQRAKSSYQSFIKLNYEHAAKDCETCPTRGECCTDEHFVNVHITRLEAVAIRETLMRSPRLNDAKRRAIHERARKAVERFHLSAKGDTTAQTYSCPLYEPSVGCLVHRRAKPAPCVQHACYDNWRDLPPANLQSRAEHRVEQLNIDVYGREWEWLPIPLWLTLIDSESDGEELERLAETWRTRPVKNGTHHQQDSRKMAHGARKRASLPVINRPY